MLNEKRANFHTNLQKKTQILKNDREKIRISPKSLRKCTKFVEKNEDFSKDHKKEIYQKITEKKPKSLPRATRKNTNFEKET